MAAKVELPERKPLWDEPEIRTSWGKQAISFGLALVMAALILATLFMAGR